MHRKIIKARTRGSSLKAALTAAMRQAQPRKDAGFAAFLCIIENSARGRGTLCAGRDRMKSPGRRMGGRDKTDQAAAKAMCAGIRWANLAALFAAAGSRDRLRMLAHLLIGPGSHQSLKRLTSLQAGPLYHHLNRLRLAGLVKLDGRDCYVLSQRGRRLMFCIAALNELMGRTK